MDETGECIGPSEEDVRQRVITAIVNLYRHDHELLHRNASERSITHKLAEHLQREFPYWHVDCEYNRDGSDPKRLEGPFAGEKTDVAALDARTVFPDIIVHRRGTLVNLVVIEVKKANGPLDAKDCAKIEDFVRSDNYRYRFGLVARLGRDGGVVLQHYDLGSGEWVDWSDLARGALKEFGYEG